MTAADPHPFSLTSLEGAESAGLRRFPNANGRFMETDGGCAFAYASRLTARERTFMRALASRHGALPGSSARHSTGRSS
jgi:choline dehydrogenase